MTPRQRTAVAFVIALAASGCATPQYYAKRPCDQPDLAGCTIKDVTISGARQVPARDIKEKIATAETSHTLAGLLEHVPILSAWDRFTVEYEKYDPFVLERDMARIERLYRARGYYEAHARAARVHKVGAERVSVEIVVDEGPPVLTGRVDMIFETADKLPERARAAARRAARTVAPGKPFTEASLEEAKKKIARALTDRGFAYATVEGKATVDLVEHKATVVFTAQPGPACTFGKISLAGYGDLPKQRLRDVIGIKEGARYSTAKIESAQIALSELRVFGSVDAIPRLSKEGQPRATSVPVDFRVTPTALKTVKLGWGAELGARVGSHGVAGWENRNFFGGLRSFSVDFKGAGIIYPFTLGSLFSTPTADVKLVPELRIHTTLVQPGFIEGRTRGLVTVDLNAYQLLPTETLGYLEFAGRTGLERDLWDARIRLGGYFNTQLDQPLDLGIPGMRLFGKDKSSGGYSFLAVPSFQATFALDLRRGYDGKRDPVNPHSGFYLANDLQFAVYGSQDVRGRIDARGYVPVSKRVTLAVRVGGGLMYAFGGWLAQTPNPAEPRNNVGTTFPHRYTDPCPIPSLEPGDTRNRWIQLMQLRGFNSGGTNSNRGYAYSAVGPQELVPGISPMGSTIKGTPDAPIKVCSPLPTATGGMAMWEASIELRFPIYDKLGMTLFLDGSDVRQSVLDFAVPFAPHLTTGLGIHYATPVGPLRADFGFRIPGAQVIGSTCPMYDPAVAPQVDGTNTCDPAIHRNVPGGFLDPKYGQAGSIRGVPLAVSLAIGEAF